MRISASAQRADRRRDGDADRGADRDVMALDHIGHRHLLDQPLGEAAEARRRHAGRAAPPRTRRRRAGRPGPPRRSPMVSRWATCFSSASPIGWPSVSLTFLKRSRSIRNKAQPPAAPSLLCSVSSSVRRISMRLGRPVSESYLARRLISSSERRCWVRSVPMPRKPRKRPYSSKLGVPDSDHQISAAGVGAHVDVGEGQPGRTDGSPGCAPRIRCRAGRRGRSGRRTACRSARRPAIFRSAASCSET